MSHHCPHCGEPIVFSHACHLAPDVKPAPAEASPTSSNVFQDGSLPQTYPEMATPAEASQPTPEPSVGGLLSTSHKILTEQFRWKAENNIRFFDGLGMSPKEKEDFLSSEFAYVYESALIATLAPTPSSTPTVHEVEDAKRLDWLSSHEANLVSHREMLGEGYGIWWNVVKRNKSLSGHPLGSVRDAIDAAIAACRKDRG